MRSSSDAVKPLALAVLAALAPAASASPARCPRICASAKCVARRASCLLDHGQPEAAKELLKRAIRRRDVAAQVSTWLLLSRAYWALGNRVWARRVLYLALADHPGDCQLRSFAAWVHLQQAELEQAEARLDERGCPPAGPLRGRWLLLRAQLSQLRGGAARAPLRSAIAQPQLFAEDRRLLEQLLPRVLPGRAVPVRLRAEVGAGFSSNALMSSPVDVGGLGDADTGSAALTFDLRGTFSPPWGRWLRPTLELGLRSLVLLAEGAGPVRPEDFTYLELSLRPGARLGSSLTLSYSGQLLLLAGGDAYGEGPRVYYESHRAELDWQATSWLTLFGGVGRSLFREDLRSRTELDGGGAVSFAAWQLRLLLGLWGRGHFARRHHLDDFDSWARAYQLWGGSLLAVVSWPSPWVVLRLRGLLSLDAYPQSAGFFRDAQQRPVRDDRRDLLLKLAQEVWSPAWHGLRLGASYELAHRASTVDSYAFTDHRVLLRLRWVLSWDPWLPAVAAPPAGHVALPVGRRRRAAGLDDERIQDLLRQEDAARRGSSCLN